MEDTVTILMIEDSNIFRKTLSEFLLQEAKDINIKYSQLFNKYKFIK